MSTITAFHKWLFQRGILGDHYLDSVALDQIQQVFMTDKKTPASPTGTGVFQGYLLNALFRVLFTLRQYAGLPAHPHPGAAPVAWHLQLLWPAQQ